MAVVANGCRAPGDVEASCHVAELVVPVLPDRTRGEPPDDAAPAAAS